MGAPSVLRRMVVRPRSRRRRRFLQRGLPSSAHGDTGIPGPFGNARVGGGCGPAPPGVRRRGQRRPVRDLRRVTLSAGLSRCGDRTVRSSPAKRSKGQNRCCAPPVAGLCNSNPVCRNKSCMCRAVAGLKTPSDQDLQDCSLFGNFTDTHTQTERKREREEESYRGGINNSNYPAYIYKSRSECVFEPCNCPAKPCNCPANPASPGQRVFFEPVRSPLGLRQSAAGKNCHTSAHRSIGDTRGSKTHHPSLICNRVLLYHWWDGVPATRG